MKKCKKIIQNEAAFIALFKISSSSSCFLRYLWSFRLILRALLLPPVGNARNLPPKMKMEEILNSLSSFVDSRLMKAKIICFTTNLAASFYEGLTWMCALPGNINLLDFRQIGAFQFSRFVRRNTACCMSFAHFRFSLILPEVWDFLLQVCCPPKAEIVCRRGSHFEWH